MSCGTGEHNAVRQYARRAGGRLYYEVPVAGPRVAASHRYIDAVRIATSDAPREFRTWKSAQADFLEDLKWASESGLEVELLEAKRRLNRSVIGQAIIAGDLFCDEYSEYGPIRLSVVVGADDSALHRVCDRRGIGVHIVVPWPGKLTPSEAAFAARITEDGVGLTVTPADGTPKWSDDEGPQPGSEAHE